MNLSELTPDTIEQWTVALTALAGTVGLVGSALASVLPKHWGLTRTLTQLFADLRGIRQPQQLPPRPLPPPFKRQDK